MSHAFDRLKNCLEDIKKWLIENKLKLNPDKTECIVFGSKIQCEKLDKSFPVNILSNFILGNFGVYNTKLMVCLLEVPRLATSVYKSSLASILLMTLQRF